MMDHGHGRYLKSTKNLAKRLKTYTLDGSVLSKVHILMEVMIWVMFMSMT